MTLHESTTSTMSTSTIRQRFRDLHVPGRPLLMPNPWDAGSAKVLASLGFRALATTSAGFAGTVGRLDGRVTRRQATRDEMKDYIWSAGKHWEGNLQEDFDGLTGDDTTVDETEGEDLLGDTDEDDEDILGDDEDPSSDGMDLI